MEDGRGKGDEKLKIKIHIIFLYKFHYMYNNFWKWLTWSLIIIFYLVYLIVDKVIPYVQQRVLRQIVLRVTANNDLVAYVIIFVFWPPSRRKGTPLTQSWRIYFSKLRCPSSPSRFVHIRGRLKGERASENERRRVLRDMEGTAKERERRREKKSVWREDKERWRK